MLWLQDILAILDNTDTVVVKYSCDTEIGLYYLKTRYYDPAIGRFISIDGIEYLDPETINGLNLYAYCNNNPVMNIDPNGTWSWKKFWRTVGAVAVAAVTVVAVAAVTVVTGGSALPVLVGAGIGLAMGAATSVATQMMTTGRIDWGQLVVDTAFGMIAGAFGGSTLGILGMTIAGGVTGFVGSVASDIVAGNGIHWGQAMISGMLGAAFGALSGGGAQHGKNLTLKSKLNLRSQRKAQGKSIRAVQQQIKNERALLSKAALRALKPDEMLLYDFVLEYAAYGTLGMFFN